MPASVRRFATVVFLDIVGSTTIAEELGDDGWRKLLARFRTIVRTELKRHGGHEVDNAGDGFFATFPQPLPAIRAARAIAEAVHEVGVDVRLGIHAGEVEIESDHVAGMTVHIGARVMALAGPAQILVTSTVRDIEHGSPVIFAEAGEHELKGVEGIWRVYSVKLVDTSDVAIPVEPEEGGERRLQVAAAHPARRPTRILAGATIVIAIGIAIGVSVLTRPDPQLQTASTLTETALVRVDPDTLATHAISEPAELGIKPAIANLGGVLLRFRDDEVERRDMSTGQVESSFPVPAWSKVSVGGGAIWLGSGSFDSAYRFTQIDPASGEKTAVARAPDGMADSLAVAAGPRGIWFVSNMGDLSRLYPLPPYRVRTWPTAGFTSGADVVVPYERGVWLMRGGGSDLIWYEPDTRRHQTISLSSGDSFVVTGPDWYSLDRVWLLDGSTSSLVPLGNGVKDTEHSIGLVGPIPDWMTGDWFKSGTEAFGSLWISGPTSVAQVREDPPEPVTEVHVPQGFVPDWIVPDEREGVLWLSSCNCD